MLPAQRVTLLSTHPLMSWYKQEGISIIDYNLTLASWIANRIPFLITCTPHPKHFMEKHGQHTVPITLFPDAIKAFSACCESAVTLTTSVTYKKWPYRYHFYHCLDYLDDLDYLYAHIKYTFLSIMYIM